MDMVRIELPALRTLRLTNIGTRDAATWVVTGPTTDIAAAIAAGGAWVLTRRGPRAVLVDRVVTVDGVPAIVPQEPTFESEATRQMDVTEMSTDMLRALLAQREAQERAQDAPAAPTAPVTSATKRTTRKSATKSTATKRTATKSTATKRTSEAQDRARAAAAAAAVADVSDEDLRALLAMHES